MHGIFQLIYTDLDIVYGLGDLGRYHLRAPPTVADQMFIIATQDKGRCEASSLAGSGHEASLSVLGSHANKAMSWLVLPWCPGSLSHHLRRAAPLDDEVLCGVANQVRAGVHHLHTLGWLHLDLKPANILYDSRTRHASICDFSISERYPLLHAVAQSRGTWCTEQYRPPELLRVPCAHYLSPHVDSWVLGCTVFEAGCG